MTCVTCNAKSLAAVALVSATHALTAFRTEEDYLVLYSFGRLLVGRPCVVGWVVADYGLKTFRNACVSSLPSSTVTRVVSSYYCTFFDVKQ